LKKTVPVSRRQRRPGSGYSLRTCRAQRAALERSLREHGGTTSYIVLLANTNVVLDGMTRWELARGTELNLWLAELALPDRAAALDWIKKHGLAHRELGALVTSCLRGELYNSRKGIRGGDRCSDEAKRQADALPDVGKQMAKEFGVSERTVDRDARLATAVAKIAKNCGAEARENLLLPAHQLTRIAIEELAEQTAEKQKETIAYLKEHHKLPPTPAEKPRGRRVLLSSPKEELAQTMLAEWDIREAEEFHKVFAKALKEARPQPRDEAA
jgi:hypothetical protein